MPKAASKLSPEEYLEAAIDAYSPAIAKRGRSILKTLRPLCPGMSEMVYDYRKNLLVSFSPTDKGYQSPFTVVFYPEKVELAFLHGSTMKDPQKLLTGSGKQVRSVEVANAKALKSPGLVALIEQELAETAAWDDKRKRTVILQNQAAVREPRRA